MKKLLACFLTLVALSAFAGGNKEPAASGQEKQVVLTIASAMQSEDPEGGLEQGLANEYMKLHPNVTIRFISTPAPEVARRMITLAASNDLPDMFFVPNDFMSQLYSMDIVADLENLLGREWLDGYNPNFLRDAKINGKMVTIPWYASPYAVIYRLDWFQELGLNIPKTWTEFVETARKLTGDTNGDGRADRWAFSMVGSRNNSGETRYMLISKSFGADEIYLDGQTWKSDIEKPEFKAGLKLFTDLYTQYGVVPPGPVEVDYSASMTLFTTEQTGMILSGPHSLGFITKQNPKLDGKLGSFVIPRDKEHISISGIGGYTITNTSKVQEIAADYMKFLTSKENAIPFGQKTGRMPTRTEAANDPFFKSSLFSGFLEAMNYCVEQETFPAYPALCDTIGEAYSTILSGSATLDNAYETLKTKAARIIAEHN